MVAEELSGEGLRVLAFATKDMSRYAICDSSLHFDDECAHTFVGLIAMMDPARHESVVAVADAKRGGIKLLCLLETMWSRQRRSKANWHILGMRSCC